MLVADSTDSICSVFAATASSSLPITWNDETSSAADAVQLSAQRTYGALRSSGFQSATLEQQLLLAQAGCSKLLEGYFPASASGVGARLREPLLLIVGGLSHKQAPCVDGEYFPCNGALAQTKCRALRSSVVSSLPNTYLDPSGVIPAGPPLTAEVDGAEAIAAEGIPAIDLPEPPQLNCDRKPMRVARVFAHLNGQVSLEPGCASVFASNSGLLASTSRSAERSPFLCACVLHVCVRCTSVVLARTGGRSLREPPNATSAVSIPAEVFLTGRALLERSGIG